MHELSVAMNIVDIASAQAAGASAAHVCEVELDVGTMSGIEIPSLEFALTIAVRDTPLEGAEFTINRLEPLFKCPSCLRRFTPDGFDSRCPECGEAHTVLVRGQELKIRSLVVESHSSPS